MEDSKENIVAKKSADGASVRISTKVLDDMEQELMHMPRPRPTRGELLEKAWASYQDARKRGATTESSGSTKNISVMDVTNGKNKVTLNPTEQDAVDLLLLILRNGTETGINAIQWNLRAFAEPIKAKAAGRTITGDRPGTSFSEGIDYLIRAAEATGVDESARRKWVADLRRIQKESGSVRATASESRKNANRRKG